MPSLHFLLAAAKEGDKDALLGLQGPGNYQSVSQSHSRHRMDDPSYEELTVSRSSSNGSSNNNSTKNNTNNNSNNNNNNSVNNSGNNNGLTNANGSSNSSMTSNGGIGHQPIHEPKSSPLDWMLSGGDTFRSTGPGPAADADLFSYQMPAILSPRYNGLTTLLPTT
jgi:hypothetical protein